LPLGKGTPGTNEEKIDLFLSLFGARRSVYPKLWINLKKGLKGYSPAYSNEWVHGVCEKPRVKCSDCPNQNFPPLDYSAIHSHLIGSPWRLSRAPVEQERLPNTSVLLCLRER